MLVIPVIDMRGGVAVAASRGDRANYRPLSSPLAASSDPVAVAEGLQRLFPFSILYVADLDGIEGRGADDAMQNGLCNAWQGSEVWIDDGGTGADAALTFPSSPLPDGERSRAGEGADANLAGVAVPPLLSSPTRGEERGGSRVAQQSPSPSWGGLGWGESQRPLIKSQLLSQTIKSYIIGSESQATLKDYERARNRAGPNAPLSLDFRGDDFIGPPELLADASLWPSRVIVMTLARVGSGEGPDLSRLASISERAKGREIYAAGGVRHTNDLRALRDIGIAGALIATALHSGRITRDDLEAIA